MLSRNSICMPAQTLYPFDALEFALWIRNRWAVPAVACVIAALLAGGFSLALPKR